MLKFGQKYQSLQKQLEESVAKFTKAEEGLNYEATNLRKNVSDLTAQIEELRKTNGKLQSELESSQSSCSSVQEGKNTLCVIDNFEVC